MITIQSMPALVFALCLPMMLYSATAESQTVKYYSQQQLVQMGQKLRAQEDKSSGVASEVLEKYQGRSTILATREKDGEAELHRKVADVFIVVDGAATLVSGGSIVNPKPAGAEEVKGTSVQGGTRVRLSKGDVIQIPANVPHQLLVPTGKTFTYFVIKVQEKQ